MKRGYFGIGIYHTKKSENIGTLWRSAYQLGAAFIFTIGRRYSKQHSDTTAAYRHIPLFAYDTWQQFFDSRPLDCALIAVEMGGKALGAFTHPERSVYMLGAEDYGLPPHIIAQCQYTVSLEAVRMPSFNVAVAGSIVMYDRLTKAAQV